MAAFHTDYTDLQVQTPITTSLLDVSNAAAATIRGVELEATTLVGTTMQVGGHLAWLDATIRSLSCRRPRRRHRRRGRSSSQQRSGMVRTRCGSIGRGRSVAASSLSLRADSTWKTTVFFTPFNDRIQRQRSARASRCQRRVRAGTPALVDRRRTRATSPTSTTSPARTVRRCRPSEAGPAILARLVSQFAIGR